MKRKPTDEIYDMINSLGVSDKRAFFASLGSPKNVCSQCETEFWPESYSYHGGVHTEAPSTRCGGCYPDDTPEDVICEKCAKANRNTNKCVGADCNKNYCDKHWDQITKHKCPTCDDSLPPIMCGPKCGSCPDCEADIDTY